MTTNSPAGISPVDRRVGRLKKKLEQRDRRIVGLLRKIGDLETSIATQAITLKRLPIDVEKAVQRALCNVRMIPILGIGGSDKVVEVRSVEKTPNVS